MACTPSTMAYTSTHHSMHTSTTTCTCPPRHAHIHHGMHTSTTACTHLPWHAYTFTTASTGVLPGPSHESSVGSHGKKVGLRTGCPRSTDPPLLPLMEAQGATLRSTLQSRNFFLGIVSCLNSQSGTKASQHRLKLKTAQQGTSGSCKLLGWCDGPIQLKGCRASAPAPDGGHHRHGPGARPPPRAELPGCQHPSGSSPGSQPNCATSSLPEKFYSVLH